MVARPPAVSYLRPPAFGGLDQPAQSLRRHATGPDLIDSGEETALASEIARLGLKPFEFQGYQGLRRTRSFGHRYDYASRRLDTAEPMPAFLLALRERAAAFAGRPADAYVQALVTEYVAGAPIGWHIDKRVFGDIVGVSLLSPCVFRLRRRNGKGWNRASYVLAPRSVYALSGEARRQWEHSIPPMETLRYSVTFRTLAAPGA